MAKAMVIKVTRRKRKMKTYTSPKAIRYYLSSMVTVAIMLVVQLLLFLLLMTGLFFRSDSSVYYSIAYLVCELISFAAVLTIINRNCNHAFKLAWIVPILLFPGAGGMLYIIVRGRGVHRVAIKRFRESKKIFDRTLPSPTPSKMPGKEWVGGYKKLKNYLEKEGFPCYSGTDARYISSGEEYFALLKEELSKAEKFIFMEYFIVHEGVMWDALLEILRERVAAGVQVRILYDGMGSLKTLPMGYRKKLQSYGIEAKVFQPFVPVLSTLQNNRDHRKITVIDGKTAFTGGVNLSDEYINEYDRVGHWKDSGIMIKGEAVRQFTRFFLETWYSNHRPDTNPEKYFLTSPYHEEATEYIQPYADTPLFETEFIKTTYMELISGARNYVYLTTPYLIPGDELLKTLSVAAKGGVDVRLITPSHSDNKIVHQISRSYYKPLVQAGVRVYEYTPGFIHSKNFVCDDTVCSVGSTNLDYRSLHLHYECGLLCYGGKAVADVKKDFLETLPKCKEILPETLKKRSRLHRLFISVIRLFEPLV